MSENPRSFPNGWRARGRNLRLLGALTGVVVLAACSDGGETPSVVPDPAATVVDPSDYDLNQPLNGTLNVNGAQWTWPVPFNVGTGNINPFLSIQNSPQESGFNTDAATLPLDTKRPTFTNALPLNWVPTIKVNGSFWREFIFDANEANSGVDAQFSIRRFDVYVCDDAGAATYDAVSDFTGNSDCIRIYDLAGKVARATDEVTSGSGLDLDYQILIPEQDFQDALDDLGVAGTCPYAGVGATPCGVYLIFHLEIGDASGDWITNATFEEMSTIPRPYVTVSKTATPSFTRTYNWDILKCVDGECANPVTVNLFPGQTHEAQYQVQVDQTGSTDSNWAVTGTITIQNPSNGAVGIAGVTDLIEGGIAASVSCPVSFPYSLAAGASLVCTYSSPLPNATQRTNTATVELVDLGLNMAEAEIIFGGPTTEVNKTVDITDSNLQNALAEDLAGDQTFNYTLNWTCNQDEGNHTNTAYVIGDGGIVLDSDPADIQINCGVLEVSKTAVTTYTRTFNWTIDKSVTPATWDLFTGDQGTSEYTVTVTKTGFTDSNWAVSGTITVHNPETFTAEVSGVTDEISGFGAVTVDCGGVSFPYSLAAGADLVCTYSSSLPNADSRTNTAKATTTGGGEFTGNAAVTFGDPTTLVNDQINVDDTYAGALGTFSDDGSTSYTRTFTCDADEGTHDNTATIVETGQSDDASVTVNCYALTVTKDADTELTRTWDWTLQKVIDINAFEPGTYDIGLNEANILESESLIVKYNITIDASSTDSDWKATGNITVTNPNPTLDATVNSVADIVSPAIAATVDCGVAFPTTIAKNGGTLNCTYSADLPDAATRTNTATATLQNYAYDKAGAGTPGGTTDFSGTASVDFAGASISEIDECVNVNDILDPGGLNLEEDLGTYCADDPLPHTFEVFRTFNTETIPLVCGENTYDNVATAVANDTGAEDSDDATINIFVECETGCTLTQGYWKTHNVNFRGGAPPDDTWYLIDPDGDGNFEGPDETFFLSGQTWFDVFWTAPQGNVYYNLAHQYMAAVLNGAAGAGAPPEVTAAIASATTLFNTYTPAQIAALKGKPSDKALRDQFISLAGILGSYNEGLIGPGHCTENTQEILSRAN